MEANVLTLEYVDLDTVAGWDRNPKRHDLKGVAASIRKYGFKDPLKFEPLLNEGKGGIVEGNGRLEVLRSLHESIGKVPRGIGYDEAGRWFVPILFGVDAPSRAAAEAYGVDHNNITVAGGDFSWNEMLRMWEKTYSDLITELAAQDMLPISVDGDDADRLAAGPAEELLTPPANDVFVDEDLSALALSVFRVVFTFQTADAEAEFYGKLGVSPEPGRILYRWRDYA